MFDKWMTDYSTGFEEAMRRNGEKLREHNESHVGLEKLKAMRKARSLSAQEKNKGLGVRDRAENDSGSSRESRSAPEESLGPRSDSMALLIGNNGRRPQEKSSRKKKAGSGNRSSPIRKAQGRRMRSKKKTPTKSLKPKASASSPTIKEAKPEVKPLPPRCPVPQQQEALRKLNQIIGRKRITLIDVLPSSLGSSMSMGKFELDVGALLSANGFSKHLEGLLAVVESRCLDSGGGGVDIKALEKEMRLGGANLTKPSKPGNAGGSGGVSVINKKSVAKQVYKGHKFSFEGSGKENAGNQKDDEEKLWWEELEEEENRLNDESAFGLAPKEEVKETKKENPWLQSFDKRMSAALAKFESAALH